VLQRKAKNPPGPVPICPGRKFLPDPRADDQLFPEHVSKTCLDRLVTPPRRCPSPILPQPGAVSRGFQEWPNAPSLTDVGGKNPSCAWQDTCGCSKALGLIATSVHPIFLRLLPLALQGMRTVSSAVLL